MPEDTVHPPLYAYLSCKSDICFLSGLKTFNQEIHFIVVLSAVGRECVIIQSCPEPFSICAMTFS